MVLCRTIAEKIKSSSIDLKNWLIIALEISITRRLLSQIERNKKQTKRQEARSIEFLKRVECHKKYKKVVKRIFYLISVHVQDCYSAKFSETIPLTKVLGKTQS